LRSVLRQTIFIYCLAVRFVGLAGPAGTDPLLTSLSVSFRKSGFPETQANFAQCADAGAGSALKNKSASARATMVVLHGSGGAGNLQSLLESVSLSACRNQFRMAALAAPNKKRNWPFESATGEGQDKFLLEFLREDLPAHFNLSRAQKREPLMLVGVSAGATFLMGDFYPRHASQFKGLALALCGGAWPNYPRIVGVKTLDVRFPLFVQIGKSDFLLEQVKAGLTRYAEMGLPVRASFTDAAGHCAFDFNQAIDAVIKSSNFFSETRR
jgi:hypothetical protein